jgi:hypothetical protein
MTWFRNPCGRYRESIRLLASCALPEAEKAAVESHLAACAACRKYCEEIRVLTVPLANWERTFAHIKPNETVQMRWSKAVRAAGRSQPVRRLTPYRMFGALWRELIWPCRRAWAGMAALWLVMWGIHVHLSDRQLIAVNARPESAPAIWQSIEEQRQVLAQLLPPANSQPIEPPRRSHPRPRSERLVNWKVG